MSKSIIDAILKYKKSIDLNIVNEINDEHLVDVDELNFDNITFKVQIAASSRKLEPKPYNFKGLSDISRIHQGNIYKYYYGSTSNYNKAKSLVQDAKAKGYATSFVVAFKDGNKVPLADVLKTR